MALTDSPDAHDATSTQVGQAAPSNSRPTVQHQGAGAEREQQSLSVTIQEAARKNIRNRPSSPTPSASVVRDGKGISSRPKPIVQIQRRPNTTHVARPTNRIGPPRIRHASYKVRESIQSNRPTKTKTSSKTDAVKGVYRMPRAYHAWDNIKAIATPSRSPTPPVKIQRLGQSKTKYTEEDCVYVMKYVRWKLKDDPAISFGEICQQLSENVGYSSSTTQECSN